MESSDNKEYVKLTSVIELIQKYIQEGVERLKIFLSADCSDYSKDKHRIYTGHDIDNTIRFNFFESISDKWYRENFHSDVLYAILNPNTKEIGRKYFMQEFVKFLGIEGRFDCSNDYEVIKEQSTGYISWKDNNGKETGQEGYIDLLIKNDAQAIIIENKINYAPDMDNQIVRYMKYVDEVLGIKEYTVVYLTLIGDKKPPLESYDSDFDLYTKKLKDKSTGVLREVCAVSEVKSLAKDFFPECCKRLKEERETNAETADSCVIAEVYIDQYRILLEHLGGRAYMMSTEKMLAEEIYSNSEKYEAAKDFVDFWNYHKDAALKEIMQNKFKKKFPNKVLPPMKRVNGADEYFWNVKDKSCFIYWNGIRELGFGSLDGEKLPELKQDKLFEIIHQIQNREGEDKTEVWVYCVIKDSATLIDDVMNALELLFNS